MRGTRVLSTGVATVVLAWCVGLATPGGAPQTPSSLTAAQLFDASKVWTIHITLPNDEFSALTPMPAPPPAPMMVGQPPPVPPPPPQVRVPVEVPSVLPLESLKMVLANGFLGPEGGRNGLSAVRGVEFNYVHASFEINGIRLNDVAVRSKGNGTYNPVMTGKVQKPSLKVDLNKYVKGQKLAGLTSLNLHNAIFDPSWMNETLALRLYRDAGVPAPRTSYARVYVTAKGGQANRYLGLYVIVENIDETFTESRFHDGGGPIFKPVSMVPFIFLSRNWADYNQMYDPKTDVTSADKARVIELCDLLSNGSDAAFASRIGEYVDLDAFAKYLAAVAWMANPDSLLQQGQNYYVHFNPVTKKYVFLAWDQDHSFGQFIPWASAESQQTLDIMHPWTNRFARAPFGAQLENNLLARTLKLETFKRKYLAEMVAFTRLTSPERIAKQVDDLTPLLRPIVAEEPKDGRVISFEEATHEKTFRRSFNQNSPDINPIKVFVPIRHANVLAQLKALGVN